EKAAAFPAVDAKVGVSLSAVDDDVWNPCKRLDIANQRRQVNEAVGFQFRRHVSRLAATIRHRLDQCALLTANVTARTDEHRNRKRAAQHRRILAAKSKLLRALNL